MESEHDPQLIIVPTKDALLRPLAKVVADIAAHAIAEQGTFSVALSGGSMPQLLAGLASPSLGIDWSKWRVFFSDERCVPLTSEDSNFKACDDHLFQYVPIPRENVHTIEMEHDPELAAQRYQEAIVRTLGSEMPKFDLVLLGMGPDGHTASLFPGHALLQEYTKSVVHITDSPKPPPNRITFTLPLINNAHNVVFVVTGEQKADVIERIMTWDSAGKLHVSASDHGYPAGMIRPVRGQLIWFLDDGAASKLPRSADACRTCTNDH